MCARMTRLKKSENVWLPAIEEEIGAKSLSEKDWKIGTAFGPRIPEIEENTFFICGAKPMTKIALNTKFYTKKKMKNTKTMCDPRAKNGFKKNTGKVIIEVVDIYRYFSSFHIIDPFARRGAPPSPRRAAVPEAAASARRPRRPPSRATLCNSRESPETSFETCESRKPAEAGAGS